MSAPFGGNASPTAGAHWRVSGYILLWTTGLGSAGVEIQGTPFPAKVACSYPLPGSCMMTSNEWSPLQHLVSLKSLLHSEVTRVHGVASMHLLLGHWTFVQRQVLECGK